MRGLAAEEEDPPRASRPFDATRAGFVMGEGRVRAGARGARGGAGARRDDLRRGARLRGLERRATTWPHPSPRPSGSREMMRAALARAGVEPEQRRLHQRARHLDAARRRGRDEGDQGRLRRATPTSSRSPRRNRDGPLLRGRGRDRGDDVRARAARRRAAADDQLRESRSRSATSTTCRTSHARPRSRWRSRTRWVSAATTPACSSVARRPDRVTKRQAVWPIEVVRRTE